MSALDRFSAPTQAWFTGAFDRPTAAQEGAWDAISSGQHALVVAPTGSGKTLAAFLWSLDRLAASPPAEVQTRCRVLYVSPLKALAVDVERNLRAPLTGIGQAAARLGLPRPEIQVGIRSGDTPADERRAFARRPPDILITTPESLFLLLTSQARESLRGVETVIIDEVHAVCGSKRGAHMAVSLDRLDELLERPAQRIGLSATVRPIEEVATFLAGGRPVQVVSPPSTKQWDLSVVVPVEDMSSLGQPTGELEGSAAGAQPRSSIWPAVEERVLDLVQAHRSTIVFANSRRLAERLTSRLNELAYERATGEPVPPGSTPAQLMAQAGAGGGTPSDFQPVASAHHGSVSREQRAVVEEALKSGRLPAVVATSSLELGIDMGAVDLVVQVESPPTVAAGLQRVGRAGHQVGAVSRGVLFPKFRGDLVQSAVVAERMKAGAIESLRYLRNPLDVLAQQLVAMVSERPRTVEDVAAVLRRSAAFAGLPDTALHAVLDMLAGRYPSDAFAELRPRLTWDRVTDTLTARNGAQRLAVTSGGTIPDRGLFGVFIVSGGSDGGGRRVGELDEEMVYESRVGDVFLLGSSSWRIEEITHDRVLVTPAPGQPGKMPFWHGDSLGRPLELGRALGAFLREVGSATPEAGLERARAAGLDEWGAANLLAYLTEQKAATGHLPDDRTLLVERFRDELGDWRLVVHSPFGAQVNAPWALVLAARLRERYGVDVASMHSDDGIVLRLPDTTGEAPEADLAILDPDDVERDVTAEVGNSALFASRFRECAARALLLPRRDPRRRTPLWQQRQRAAQLLAVASEFSSFPITLEAVREVLQDVYDVPGLVELMRDVRARRVRVADVQTQSASPFAQSLLFGYVGQFIYEGDAPLAERRAQALALDTGLLAELLGRSELRELLDAEALAEIEAELQRLPTVRHPRDMDGGADVLRVIGDLTPAEAAARGVPQEWLDELVASRRALVVRIAGESRHVAIEDAGRLRDALGTALPVGVPEVFTEPVGDPLGDLVGRYARTHGPFVPAEVATRLGLGIAVVAATLQRLVGTGRLVTGEFRPGGTGQEWCDAEVLRSIRRRSLAKLRQEVEPVPIDTLARFTPSWQSVGGRLRGVDGVLAVVEQLAGALVPASALETLVLPSRVRDYQPAMLDELTSAGEVLWAGAGGLSGGDGWLTLVPADLAPVLLPEPPAGAQDEGGIASLVLEQLAGGQALFFRGLSDRVGATDDQAFAEVVWDLVWAGRLTNDTLAPLRARLSGGGTHKKQAAPPRARLDRTRYGRTRLGRPAMPSRTGPPMVAGRWSRLPDLEGGDRAGATKRTTSRTEALLERHGVLTRGAVMAEQVVGGFSAVYPVLRAYEENGRARRGYFVETLGAAQFGTVGAIDRLRSFASPDRTPTGPVVLAATDPANVYGAALPWPDRAAGGADADPVDEPAGSASAVDIGEGTGRRKGPAGHRAGRKAGALVVLVDGQLVLYVERGGKTLLSWTEDETTLKEAATALSTAAAAGALGRMVVQKADGASVHESTPLSAALQAAGFSATPRGLRLRS
ncbi:ATP-dependent helicase [Modestobacter sp. I12A-02628]|uniref:ATP-dependent helicase n=1 Tax=Goekera deserti TaxID=2497753 RepID=A0A7K3WI38_9ACTN|nr:ATP-dependent helicase [Goekera deserti]MPQ96353.1 ATP-dependent helicase [Goekera deserti]NDI50521.1 ATP-dependent helicase [Goekera deserti]NEL56165.1 ATP-dependent helicase [Goekera deserti]